MRLLFSFGCFISILMASCVVVKSFSVPSHARPLFAVRRSISSMRTIPIRQATPSRVSVFNTNNYYSNEELAPGIAAIDAANDDLFHKLNSMRNRRYFRLYSVDILASCEYMPQELFECYSETCEIYPVDEDEVPAYIRKVDAEDYDFALDGWGRWDMPSEDYYDTQLFPESYTGYDGSMIWRFIHERIAFEGYGYDNDHWKSDFNKAVSGIHSMISAQIVKGIKDRVDQGEAFSNTEIWRDPVAEFKRRLGPSGETKLAIENLYFTYMLLLAAVAKARNRLQEDIASGKMSAAAGEDLGAVLASPLLQNPSIIAASTKLHNHAVKDQDSVGALWEARMRSRELLRIMNCVQCNKCRLHGKIGMMGLSTALQILVGQTGQGGELERVHRVELAALVTTLYKFSRAVKFCKECNR